VCVCVCVCGSITAHPGEPKLTAAMASWHWYESIACADLAYIPCWEIWTVTQLWRVFSCYSCVDCVAVKYIVLIHILITCSALTLFIKHPACKNWVMRCYYGTQSVAKCQVAYGPVDAICQPVFSCFIKMQNGLPFWCSLSQIFLKNRLLNWWLSDY